MLSSWQTVKIILPQEVHQQSICKWICPSKCQLTNSTHHIVILWAGVSCSPTEYPAFQSNISACSFQADTHPSRYTVSWPRWSQYKSSLLWKPQNSLLQRQYTLLLHGLLAAGTHWHAFPADGMQEGGRRALPGSSLPSPDPIKSSGSWDSSPSIDAPPGLPKITNYNSPTICIMLTPFALLVSKILLDNVPLTWDSLSLQGRLMTGAQWACEGKGSRALLSW
jgi:hypothetical protein